MPSSFKKLITAHSYSVNEQDAMTKKVMDQGSCELVIGNCAGRGEPFLVNSL